MALNLFLQFTKVDASQRIVYGALTVEQPDRSKEIMDYATSKPYFEAWSGDMYKASNGKNYGNVRHMHKAEAAGMFVEPLEFDDDNRRILGKAWIQDDDAWAKVEAGILTGFSVGGKYGKRWKSPDDPDCFRYTGIPAECSIVDMPCVPDSTFQYIKAEGALPELRKFNAPPKDGEDPIGAEGANLSKAEEDDADPKPKETQEDPKSAEADLGKAADPAATPAAAQTETGTSVDVEQVWKAKDGTFFAKKADAVRYNQGLEAKAAVQSVTAGADDALEKLSNLLDPKGDPADPKQPSVDDPKVDPKADALNAILHKDFGIKRRLFSLKNNPDKDVLGKGLYDVGRIACIVSELRWLAEDLCWEAEMEKDGSPLPAQAKGIVAELCGFLVALVKEETSELIADMTDDAGEVDIVYMAASGLKGELRKALQTEIVDGLFKDQLIRADVAETAKDEHTQELLSKGFVAIKEEDLSPDNETLPVAIRAILRKNAGLEEKVTGYAEGMNKLIKRVEELAAMPEPRRPVGPGFKPFDKTDDIGGGGLKKGPETPEEIVAAYDAMLKGMTTEQRASHLMKMALRNPILTIE